MKRTKVRWRKLGLSIFVVVAFLVCMYLYLERLSTADFRTNGEVIRAVIQASLGSRRADSPRVIAISCGYPQYEFAVTRGKPDDETVVAAGRFDRSNYWKIREWEKLPKTLWDVFPQGTRATFARPSLFSLFALEEDEDDYGRSLPWTNLYNYGLAKGWFRNDEDVSLIFIDRYQEVTVSQSCSWDIVVDYVYGKTAKGFSFYVYGEVNLKTLEIKWFPVE